METLKKFLKYILMVIGMYVFTAILIFIGFNLNYSKIANIGGIPSEISIEKAESSKCDGRIYGYISNEKGNNVNGKYIKTVIYDINSGELTTQFLKINGVEYGTKKMFKIRFNVDGAKMYSISIVDSEE